VRRLGAFGLSGAEWKYAKADLSTEQSQKGEDAWVSGAHEDKGRSGDPGPKAGEGPPEAQRE